MQALWCGPILDCMFSPSATFSVNSSRSPGPAPFVLLISCQHACSFWQLQWLFLYTQTFICTYQLIYARLEAYLCLCHCSWASKVEHSISFDIASLCYHHVKTALKTGTLYIKFKPNISGKQNVQLNKSTRVKIQQISRWITTFANQKTSPNLKCGN